VRTVLILAFVLCALGLLAQAADAHAWYLRSNPAADARLVRAPTEVRVAFTEPPDPRGSEIQVLAVDGRRLDRRDVRATEEPNGLAVGLEPLGDGGYTVAWTVLSTVDGHTTKGSFVFAVGEAPLPAVPDVGPAVAPPTALELAGRVLSFAGIALAIGVGVFGIVVRPLLPAASGARESQLIVLAAALLVLGPALLAADQGPAMPGRLALLLGVRAAAGVALVGALRAGGLRHELTAALGIVAATTATLVSHAAASGASLEIALDLVHVLAVSVWLGGLVALGWTALPFARVRDAAEAGALGRAVWRFSLVALVAVATLVLTGTLQSLRRLVLPQDLVETPYGIALLAKIVLLLAAVALGALNLLVWGPRLRRALAPGRARSGLVRGTAAETALLAVVLVATGVLTALAPPAQASGAAFDQTQHVAGLRLQLLLPTTQPGRNRYVLRVHQGLRPVTDAQKVAFRFTMVEHDMGETELVARQRAPGEYVAEGSVTVMFGTWRAEAIVRLADRDDVRAVFSVPIGAGTAATAARALRAGPYTLVAFTDPAPVVAGAPFSLHVVVVDGKGDPVPARAVLVTPSGPGRAAAATAAEASPGRYVVPFAALDAGAWQLVISLDGVSAAYPLDVTP
jgi:copper transport protein